MWDKADDDNEDNDIFFVSSNYFDDVAPVYTEDYLVLPLAALHVQTKTALTLERMNRTVAAIYAFATHPNQSGDPDGIAEYTDPGTGIPAASLNVELCHSGSGWVSVGAPTDFPYPWDRYTRTERRLHCGLDNGENGRAALYHAPCVQYALLERHGQIQILGSC